MQWSFHPGIPRILGIPSAGNWESGGFFNPRTNGIPRIPGISGILSTENWEWGIIFMLEFPDFPALGTGNVADPSCHVPGIPGIPSAGKLRIGQIFQLRIPRILRIPSARKLGMGCFFHPGIPSIPRIP